MKLVNSNEKLLNKEDVLYIVGENIGFSNDAKEEVATALEFIRKADDFLQVGNTLFMYNVRDGIAYGQVFNGDTGRNFINNCKRYFAHLQERQVVEFNAVASDSISRCLHIFKRLLRSTDSHLKIFTIRNRSFMKLAIGLEPLKI